jgi:hypothetical protein
MKRAVVAIIAAVVALSFAGVARAIPVNSDMNSAIGVLENEDQGSKPAKKPATAKKQRKHGKAKVKKVKKAAPASSETPAAPAGQPKEK